jgi:hypothetical protein
VQFCSRKLGYGIENQNFFNRMMEKKKAQSASDMHLGPESFSLGHFFGDAKVRTRVMVARLKVDF